VKDAPAGEVRYCIALGSGEPSELLLAGDGGDVVLVESFDTAQRIAAGASISDELAEGGVKIEGDVGALVAAQAEIAKLAAALA
jgi:hypothetical protein